MELMLTDSQSGKKRTFEPIDPGCVTMYVCGPTVYNFVHIGNGRPAVVFDTLFRLLRKRYPQVRYARNITDIDDKINAAAAELGEPFSRLAGRYADAYEEDLEGLAVLPPTFVPRATEHIDQIIAMTEKLIESGHAYEAEGHVLFSVPADRLYGTLSRRSLEDMLAGARVDVAPYKQDPKDYVLWKPSTEAQPGWASPWGRGRPGWHIECSAMIAEHLGERIDIHGGGSDLLFPHHENEAAQSRCALQHDHPVNYWLHNGMLTLGAEKMSKSLGNTLTLRDLLTQHRGEALRYALLAAHYRASLAWSSELLDQAKKGLDTFYQALRVIDGFADRCAKEAHADLAAVPDAFARALHDDLNTPRAIAEMHALAKAINTTTDADERAQLGTQLLACGWFLGLLNSTAETWFQGSADSDDGAAIDALVAQRDAAKKARDFARADAIRDELAARGIELEDTRQGTRWRRQ